MLKVLRRGGLNGRHVLLSVYYAIMPDSQGRLFSPVPFPPPTGFLYCSTFNCSTITAQRPSAFPAVKSLYAIRSTLSFPAVRCTLFIPPQPPYHFPHRPFSSTAQLSTVQLSQPKGLPANPNPIINNQ
jgi:hypothetical protein